jgi:hypothetical protein
MAGSLLRASFSVISPQHAPPRRGQSLPEWGLVCAPWQAGTAEAVWSCPPT